MLTALLTDIHANLEALSACIDHARRLGADRYAFLGDLVGYGADPGPVVDVVRTSVAHGAIAVLGNHDQAVAQKMRVPMNPDARKVIEWTRGQLNAVQLAFLGGLPLVAEENNHLYVHANAWDPGRWEYIHGRYDAGRSLRATRCQITFCGHVHEPMLYQVTQAGHLTNFRPVAGMGIPLPRRRRWLALPGSVGQPRDGIPAASYAVFEAETAVLTFFRVPFDTEGAARKIRQAGLPEGLGLRLEAGT
jgi:diadenosine tetraphosphatase ApaH/serine/threonine PP2A family protein phosphatase